MSDYHITLTKDMAEQYLDREISDEEWPRIALAWRKEITSVMARIGTATLLEQALDNMPSLPAFRVTFDDGEVIETSMAADVTLDKAADYYIGKRFTKEDETTHLAIGIEQIA